MSSKEPVSPDQPVAYDADGQPLYLHPQAEHGQDKTNIQSVHTVRSTDPEKPIISEETKLKNERSKQAYPGLNLSEHEYIIFSVKRHPIGLLVPFLLGIVLIITAMIVLFIPVGLFELNSNQPVSFNTNLVLPITLFVFLVVLGMYVVYYIFTSNKFFLTNESVIQEIQISLFSKRDQTVSLANIEDASYTQNGILQHIFNYGSIRLSTVGDENTYRLTYVVNPERQIDTLNNAVEAFKNGRPVEK